ncbi:hypothetical protein [Candidatus Nitrospira salsa]|nr:MAG: hypothetical protein NPIRA01_37280 [Nitrospirales bacterium]
MIDYPIGSSEIEIVLGLIGFLGVLLLGMANVLSCPPETLIKENARSNLMQYQVRFGWRDHED